MPARELGAGEAFDLSLMASGYIRYIPSTNAFGVAADSFTYQVMDNGGAPFTAVALDPTPNTMTFDIGGVNDMPALTDLEIALSLTEGDAPTLIDADVTFSDAEDNFDGGSLFVTGAVSGDVLSIRHEGTDTGEIGLSGANVTYGGITIGSYALVGLDLAVDFTAAATSAAIEALIENLTYSTISDAPHLLRMFIVASFEPSGMTLSPTVHRGR